MPKNIFYSFPVYISFVKNDETLLKKYFNVTSFHFKQSKILLVLSFFKHFWALILNIGKTNVYVSFFAGYSSFLPAIFAKLTNRPHLIILGGTDCSSFPSINYGNYRKFFLGFCTRYSIQHASHLIPVDISLVSVDYTYLDEPMKQGYLAYCHNPETPFTVVNIGYDFNKFYCDEPKIPNSFITVGQMNPANFYRKGIDLILETAKKYTDARFTIIGDSKGMTYGEIPENVKIMPFVPYEQLRQEYAKHEFYFQLSLMEGFPSAPCEAMLCECIPITSNVGALPTIVGDTGFILEKKNFAMLSAIVQEALNSDRPTLAKNARKRIISNFPPETRLQLIQVINKYC